MRRCNRHLELRPSDRGRSTLFADPAGRLPEKVFVTGEWMLDASIGVAQARMANLARGGGLSDTSKGAYQGGMNHLLRVGPLGELPGVSRLVRVRSLEPVYRANAMTLVVRWEATGLTGGLFPVLDADITLTGDNGERTRLAISGCYRPPFGVVGAALDRVLLHTVATMTLQSLLARLAPELEGRAEAACHEAVSRVQGIQPQIAPE